MDNERVKFYEEAHLYLLDDWLVLPSVTQLLEKVFPDKYKGIPKWILDRKAKYGSHVHSTIEKLEKKEEYQIESVYVKASIGQYLEIKEKYNIKVLSQEEVVCYKGIYAGKYDMIALVNDEESLIDIKTTAELDKKYLSWQLSMYELAIGKKFKKLYCLWLPKGGLGKLIEIERIEKEKIQELIGEKE